MCCTVTVSYTLPRHYIHGVSKLLGQTLPTQCVEQDCKRFLQTCAQRYFLKRSITVVICPFIHEMLFLVNTIYNACHLIIKIPKRNTISNLTGVHLRNWDKQLN